MRKLIPYLLVFAMATSAAQSFAQQSDRYEQRLNDIEKILKKLPQVSGYVQFGYQWSDNPNNDESTFHIRRARLSLSGSLHQKLADYKVQAELSGSPKVLDAYVRLTPYKALNLQVGQFKVPFSIENVDYSPSRLETIDYPMALQKLMGYSESIGNATIKASGRDIGATLYGSLLPQDGYSILSYRIGLFNGTGINTKDNNSSKDIAARININPIKELTISGSYFRGEWDKTYVTRERYAVGAAYEIPKGVFVRSEYLWGKTDDIKSDGLYVLFGCYLNDKLSSVVRYDTFNEDKDADDIAQTNYLIGLDYKMCKNIRLQLNYTLQHFEQNHPTATTFNHQKLSLVQMMLTGSF